MREKNPAAVALGRLGGQARVRKGFGTLSPEERSAKAKEGALARWGKVAGSDAARQLVKMRRTFAGGRPPTCNCGTCEKCLNREAKRAYRAGIKKRAVKKKGK